MKLKDEKMLKLMKLKYDWCDLSWLSWAQGYLSVSLDENHPALATLTKVILEMQEELIKMEGKK